MSPRLSEKLYTLEELVETLEQFPNIPSDVMKAIELVKNQNQYLLDLNAGTFKSAPDGPNMRRATLGERLYPIQEANKHATALLNAMKNYPTYLLFDEDDPSFLARLTDDLKNVQWKADKAEEWVRKYKPKNKQRQRNELLASAIARFIKRLTGQKATNGYNDYKRENTGSFPVVALQLAPILNIQDEIDSIIESHRRYRPE